MNNWQDIRRKARLTRARVDLQKTGVAAPGVIGALIGQARIAVAAYPSDHPLLRGARASWRGRGQLMVVDAALSPEERAFPMAHELGHRECHAGLYECGAGDIDEAPAPVALPVGEGRVWGYNPRQAREIEANVFAAELLAPAAELRARFLEGADSAALAALYGVTPTCALNQLLSAVLGGADLPTAPDDSSADVSDHPLDAHQRAAAEAAHPRVLVDAGPGTGKTHTLVARVAHLLSRPGVSAEQILVLTFSNRAADELRQRLRRATPDGGGVTIVTFHGFALDTLRQFAPQAGLPLDVRVVDDADASLLLRQALPTLGLLHYKSLSWPERFLPGIVDAVGCMRDELITSDTLDTVIDEACAATQDEQTRQRLRETRALIASYNKILETHGVLDYGGIIERAVHLLHDDPAIAATLRRRYRHVLVDEYQDTNRASAVLLQAIARTAESLWVVGDVRQAIYRFRGASPENMDRFEQDFPGTERMALHVNYRSTGALVSTLTTAAATMTGASPGWTTDRAARDGDSRAVVLAEAPDYPSEIAGILADIQRSVDLGRAPEEHAVLCSTHGQAAMIAAALEDKGFPTSYLGNFFLRPEVKDMLALLELCRGPDGAALLRLSTWEEYRLDEACAEALVRAAREVGVPFPAALRDARVLDIAAPAAAPRRALQDLGAQIEAVRYYPDPASVLMHYLFGHASYLRTLLQGDSVRGRQAAAAIFQLVVLTRGFRARPPVLIMGDITDAFLRYARRLLADGENGVYQATAAVRGAVNVLTVHASKGAEFPVVYVPNLGRGRFPVHGADRAKVERPPALQRDRAHRSDDDRRLFFVAISRAKERLVMSRSLRYGRKSNPADVLELVRGADQLTVEAWPLVAASPDVARVAVAEHGPSSASVMHDHEVMAMARCPREHHYRDRLGVRGGAGAHEYGRFVRALRDGFTWLRTTHPAPGQAGSWADAEAALMGRWSEAWGEETPLESFYRAEALRLYRRAYDRRGDEVTTTGVRLRKQYIVDVDNQAIAVHVDAVEERDGRTHLVWERVTSKGDDATSLTIALYGAVVQTAFQGVPATVEIRCLDGTDPPLVGDASRVLEQHRPFLRELMVGARAQRLPARPAKPEYCTRCSFSFVCPGPARSLDTD